MNEAEERTVRLEAQVKSFSAIGDGHIIVGPTLLAEEERSPSPVERVFRATLEGVSFLVAPFGDFEHRKR
jgi:hypothetical protein